MQYEEYANIMKALSDPNRIKILDLLSCGNMCACDILEHFEFTQPTLSHHMKILVNTGFVEATKDGKWNRYAINEEKADRMIQYTLALFSDSGDCLCKDTISLKGDMTHAKNCPL